MSFSAVYYFVVEANQSSQDTVKKFAKKDPVAAQAAASKSIHPMLRAASSSLELPERVSKDRSISGASSRRITRNSETARGESIDISSDGQQNSNRRITRTKKKSPMDMKRDKVDVEMLDASDTMASGSKTNGDYRGLPVLLDALKDIRRSVLDAIQEGKSKRHPDQLIPSTWHNKVYLACRIKHRLGGLEVCEYYAKDLAQLLGPEWRQSELYKWVKANVNKKPEFQYSSEDECLGLIRRNTRQPKVTVTEDMGQSSHAGKQPASELVGKQLPRKRGRPSGKAAILRPSLGGKKRPWLDDREDEEDNGEIDTDHHRKSRKVVKKSRYFYDDDEAASSAAEDEDEEQGEEDEEEEEETAEDKPLTRLVIRAEQLPSTTPRGPNNTWTCSEPDCGYVVRAADEENGQGLISAHYENHEKEARDDEAQEAALKTTRADLAVQEAGGQMPIKYAYFPPFLIQVHYLN